eukprot:bmy_06213T0
MAGEPPASSLLLRCHCHPHLRKSKAPLQGCRWVRMSSASGYEQLSIYPEQNEGKDVIKIKQLLIELLINAEMHPHVSY